MKQHELILKIITIVKPNYVILVVSKVCLDLLVIKHNCTEVRHILREDSVASRVVGVIVTREGLRKSSDILDTSGNNKEENQTTGLHQDLF